MLPMKRSTLGLAIVCLGASSAHADVLRSTLEQPLFEVSHSVDVRIEDGVATFKVKRQFANPGKIADEAALEIDLPAGGAATGLISGTFPVTLPEPTKGAGTWRLVISDHVGLD